MNGFSEYGWNMLITEMGKKLQEFMSDEEYSKFSMEIAKKAFKADIDHMEESDFKAFVLENFDTITQ